MPRYNLSRRDFMKLVGAGAAAASLGGLMPRVARARGLQTALNLDFIVWSYSVETVLANIALFEEKYPGLTVTLAEAAWPQYRETIINRFTAGTPTDVLYSGGDWLPEWAKAGWLVPLEDYFPQVLDYVSKTAPYAVSDMTYDGKLYGLPYYADTTSFLYNANLLEDAGISAPPTTWEEVEEQANKLKENGIAVPIALEFAQAMPTTLENFTAMVFGRGGELLDENLDPILDNPAGAAYAQLTWLANMNKAGMVALLPHETDVVKAMNTGQHAFTVLYNYNLAELNNAATSPLAGQFKLGIMPGGSGQTYGFAKFYSMTKMAVDRGQEAMDAAWKFIEYFGGEVDGQFGVAKGWAVEKGLGFGQLPLFDDPDVQASFSQWVDVDVLKEQCSNARGRHQGTWYGVWAEVVRLELVRAVSGETTVDEALANAAQSARDLKEQYG